MVKSVLNADENETRNIRGLLYRHGNKVVSNEPPYLIRDLNKYPAMDCDDYFEQLVTISPGLNLDNIDIKIEFNRGCWWGQNSQCTFCGLNGLGISYRSKSHEKALTDLLTVSKKYKTVDFTVTDNILNPVYVTTMLKQLSQTEIELNLFFEVKAALSKEQIRIMSNAGVRLIQPGIESLSSHVLKLMRKGTTMLLNIQTLKWLKQFYIQPLWNILYGFPGENDDDFLIQERVIPYIFHLTPPGGISNIEMHRFSPNFDFRDEFGFKQVTPLKDYSYIYPNNIKGIEEIAYYFDYDKHYQRAFTTHVGKINSLISEWKTKKRSTNPPYLNYRNGPKFLKIYDNRNGRKIELTYTGIEKEIILICDKVRSFREINEMIHHESSHFELNDAMRTLLEEGILLEEDGNYLSLPVKLIPRLGA
ncbi:MAG: RiPP maturation radical SAM C-methyltransferase [Thermoplasmatales archaeon]